MASEQLAQLPSRPAARLARLGLASRSLQNPLGAAAARFRRREPQSSEPASRSLPRRGFSAAGGRLRRVVLRPHSRLDSRQAPRHPADVGRADLLGGRACGEGRSHRRPVRQASLQPHRNGRRRGAAVIQRPHHQRPDFFCRCPRAPSREAHNRLQSSLFHAQPAARLHQRRFRRPAASALVEPRVRGLFAARPTLRASGIGHRLRPALHESLRFRQRA